jgi:hypothetical protein
MLDDSFVLKSNLSSHKIRLNYPKTIITYDDLIEFGFDPNEKLKDRPCFELSCSNNSIKIQTFSHFECFLDVTNISNLCKRVRLKEKSDGTFNNFEEIKLYVNGTINKENHLHIKKDRESGKNVLLDSPNTNEKILNEIIEKYSIFKRKDSVKIDMNVNVSIDNSKDLLAKSVTDNQFALFNSNAKRVRDKEHPNLKIEPKITSIKKENKCMENNHNRIDNYEEKKDSSIGLSSTQKFTPKKKKKRLIKSKVLQMSSPKNTCAICLDGIKTKTQLDKCKHEFCKECIENWANMTNLCPLCKEEFTKLTYYVNNEKKVKRVEKKKLQLNEEESENEYMDECFICGRSNNESLLLVCDYCDYFVCHTYCDNLQRIPSGEWKCQECRQSDIRLFEYVFGIEDEIGKNSSDSSFISNDSRNKPRTLSESRYYLRSRVISQNQRRESFSSNRVLNVNLSLRISTNSTNFNVPERSTRYNLRSRNRNQN